MDLQNVLSIVGYISLVGGALLALKSRIPAQTISNYEKLTTAQDKRIKALEDQSKIDHENHIENIKAIADLQGQIKVYKELPLQDMAIAMKDISSATRVNADYSREILESLKSSAITLKHDTAETFEGTAKVALELKNAKAGE